MKEKTQLDDFLFVRNNHLFIEKIDTVDLAERFGTPLLVISENQLRTNYRTFKEEFSKHWPEGEVEVLPSVKANWISAVEQILVSEGAGADVYSPGELFLALKSGINPEKISVNGGGKEEEFLEKCIREGVRITIEDLDEPELINRIARKLGKKAYVRIRIKPNMFSLQDSTDFALEKVTVDLGIQVYKSGVPLEFVEEMGRKILQMEYVELTGLHFHTGRHKSHLKFWKKSMRMYAQIVAGLISKWKGWKPKEIDIGGGFASYRDPHSKSGLRADILETWFSWPLMKFLALFPKNIRYGFYEILLHSIVKKAPEKRSPSIEEYAQAAAGTLYKELKNRGVDLKNVKLQIEPGRSMFANTGIHLTKVKKFKKQNKPIKWVWALTDTTYFFMTGGFFEYNFHDFVFANKFHAEKKHVGDVVGQSCFADRIIPSVKLPELEPGDLIALLDMGAYQEVSAANFNALPRHATVLVNGDKAELIKRAETIEDVFSRDLIPERLK